MGIQIWEIFGSRSVSRDEKGRRTTYLYMLAGSNDQDVLEQTLTARTPPYLADGQKRERVAVEQAGPGYWKGTVEYAHPEKKEDPEGELSFDISTDNTRITHALEQRIYENPDLGVDFFIAPDFDGAINVTGDGAGMKVEGVDIPVPKMSFTLTHSIPQHLVTLDYISTLYALAGKTNEAPWKGFGEQELTFMGARGATKGDEPYRVGFNFTASQSTENLAIGPIKQIRKLGHEYLWVRYEPKDDEDAGVVIPTPVAAYVCKVKETADFTELGIGS